MRLLPTVMEVIDFFHRLELSAESGEDILGRTCWAPKQAGEWRQQTRVDINRIARFSHRIGRRTREVDLQRGKEQGKYHVTAMNFIEIVSASQRRESESLGGGTTGSWLKEWKGAGAKTMLLVVLSLLIWSPRQSL